MKQITVYIDDKILEYIDQLVNLKLFPSRNEAMRTAFREFVSKESHFLSNLNADLMKLRDIHKRYVEFEQSVQKRIYNKNGHING